MTSFSLQNIHLMTLAQYLAETPKNDADVYFVEDDAPVEKVQDLGVLTANTTINGANGNIIKLTVGAAIALTFTANAGTNMCRVLLLHIKNGGAFTLTWPANVKWLENGITPTMKTSGDDFIWLYTDDNGTSWYGSHSGSIA